MCWFTVYIYREIRHFVVFVTVENRKFRPVSVLSRRNVLHHLPFVSVPPTPPTFFPCPHLYPLSFHYCWRFSSVHVCVKFHHFVKCCQQNRPFLMVFCNVYVIKIHSVYSYDVCCLCLCIMVSWMHTLTVHTNTHTHTYIYIYTTTFIDNVFVIKIIILTWWCVLWSGLLPQDEIWMNERMTIYGAQTLPHTKPCVHFVQGFSNASTDCTHRSRMFTVAGTKEAQHVLVKKCEQMLTLRHSPWWETTPKLAGKRANFKIVHQYLWPKTPLQNKQNRNSFRLGNLSHIFLKN